MRSLGLTLVPLSEDGFGLTLKEAQTVYVKCILRGEPARIFRELEKIGVVKSMREAHTGRLIPDYLFQNSRMKILSHKELNLSQIEGEDERAFTIRLRDMARERRDARRRIK